MNDSSRKEGIKYDIPDSSLLQENSWFRTLSETEMDDFQHILGSLTGVQLCATTTSTDDVLSNGSVRKLEEEIMAIETSAEPKRKQDDRSKRTRSSKQHSMSEKKRRNRINQSLKTLKELIPNCHKSDTVSVLDDAIKYLTALEFQVQNMSADGGGGVKFQAPNISPTGIHRTTMEARQFSPFGYACYCPTMISAGPRFNPLPSGDFALMPVHGNYAVPQFRMQYIHSQQLPGTIPSAMAQNLSISGFSPGFNFSIQEGYFPTSK